MSVAVGIVASSHKVPVSGPPVGYVTIPATSSNALKQTPDDNPTITDLVITARLYLASVPGSGTREICERWVTSSTGTNRFIYRFDATAKPVFIFQQAGATQTRTATVAWPFASGVWGYIRMTFTPDNGSSQHVVLFETSVDGSTWTVLDTVITGGVASIDNGTGALAIGNRYFGSALGLNGAMSDLKVVSGGVTLFEMHAEVDLIGVVVAATSFVSTSGHTVSVLRSSSPALVLVPPASLTAALALNGSSKYSRSASGLNLTTTSITWSAWVKLTAISSYKTIIASDDASSHYCLMGVSSGGSNFYLANAGSSAFNFTPGQWTFVAVTIDRTGAECWLYYAPAPATTLVRDFFYTVPTSHLLDTNTFFVGGDGFSSNWAGSIAAVKIWNAVLTQAELTAEAAKYAPVRAANLWAAYKFNGGPQTVDDSGNGRPLTVTFGTPGTDASGPPIT